MSQSTPQGIPIRRVLLNHLSELPNDYGTTPGGTLFSTTPGGTRIIYDRSFLLKCRSSPLSNTPPTNLPDIPGVTAPDKPAGKIGAKIVEENEAVGKENGGKFHLSNPAFGYDAYMNAKSPLQQYRQRSLFQQKAALYEKAYQEISDVQSAVLGQGINLMPAPPCSPIMSIQQPAQQNMVNNYSGDGAWQEPYNVVPPSRKTCPTSQLSLWRQTKMNQAISQAAGQPVSSTTPQHPNNLPPGHPGLSIYRGRGHAQGMWPANLCDSLEKLFKAHNGTGFPPNPTHSSTPYTSYTPAYGHYYSTDAGYPFDSNSNLIQ